MKLWLIVASWALGLIALSSASSNLRCVSDKGSQVDWWVILKFPTPYASGLQYVYYDAKGARDFTTY